MKKFFLLIGISAMIFGCSNENEPNQTEVIGEIVGQWKLISVHQRIWDSYLSDESAKNIIYNFKANGILDVSEATALLNKGEHSYSFGEETLTIDGQNFESQVVTINNQKWLYSFSDGKMRISKLDSDFGSLTFVKH